MEVVDFLSIIYNFLPLAAVGDFEARHCPPDTNPILKPKLQIYTEPRHRL